VKGTTSASSENRAKRKVQEGTSMPRQQPAYPREATPKKLRKEVSNALSNDMQRVSVKEGRLDLNIKSVDMKDKVSSLESYADSSGQSDSASSMTAFKSQCHPCLKG
jgi:hypothetical protein